MCNFFRTIFKKKKMKRFYRAVVFSSNPLKGHYKFEDKFQIYPLIGDNVPTNDKVKLFPVVLEYWVDKEDEVQVPAMFEEVKGIISKTTHSTNHQKRILSLLSSLSNYRFIYPLPELQWFTEIPSGEMTEEVNKQTSKGGINYFWYPEMQKESVITKFSEPQFPNIEFSKHPDCFIHLDIDGEEPVKFTKFIDVALHNYFALADDAKEIVDSATSLICNGIDLRTKMKSLSFVSFVSSIETMVNYEFRDEVVKKCEACGTEQYRVMGKFREYLFKYASDNPDTKKEINDIYKLRSNIVHAGLLFLGDNKIDWSDDKKQNDQWQTHIKVMQISRVSLTNWLLMRGQEEKGEVKKIADPRPEIK
jgi:hypothetical protein